MHVWAARLYRATLTCALAVLTCGPASADGVQTMGQVTVEAQRERDRLRHEVNEFVSKAIVKPYDESLPRWDHPICPLVAGLNRDQGEFVLNRLSEIAVSANAPLGKEKCEPNFFVIVTGNPSAFLNELRHRKPAYFSYRRGVPPVERFIETPRPIRVWYNAKSIGADAGVAFTDALAASVGMGTASYPAFGGPSQMGSRITTMVVEDIESAIVVVDATQIQKLNFGQLVDYIGLIGLAQINLDGDFAQAPTILKVFNASETSLPLEMTRWDRALLRSLYGTPQKDRMQMSEMKTAVFKYLAADSAH